jgi:hypothetical protein
MADIKYDNDGDRYTNGFDAGVLRDGTVTLDEKTGHLVLVDEDGIGFDPQAALAELKGKRVRLTMISFESLQNLAEIYAASQNNRPS